jgi:hypothetical protein
MIDEGGSLEERIGLSDKLGIKNGAGREFD